MRLELYMFICLSICGLISCEEEEESTGEAAGTEAAGTEAAGTEAAGTEAAGTEAAGTEAAGTEAAGTEAAGTEVAGTEVAGAEAAGVEEAGQTMSGFANAEDLSSSYTQLGVEAQEAASAYCTQCSESPYCGEILFDTATNLDEATCLMENASAEQLAYLAMMISCERASVATMSSCIEMISVCDDGVFTECLYLYGAECDYNYSYMAQMDHACFGGPEPFNCMSGDEVVPSYWYCDGFPDCADESDEPESCPEPFMCEDGLEISASWVCDGEADCSGGEDEANCSSDD